jgi:hypothetical protein
LALKKYVLKTESYLGRDLVNLPQYVSFNSSGIAGYEDKALI